MKKYFVLMALVIVAGLGTVFAVVILGKANHGDVIVENPYKTGMQFHEVSALKERLGIVIETEKDTYDIGQEITFLVYQHDEATLLPMDIRIKAGALHTKTFQTSTAHYNEDKGVYLSGITPSSTGWWDILFVLDIDQYAVQYEAKVEVR